MVFFFVKLLPAIKHALKMSEENVIADEDGAGKTTKVLYQLPDDGSCNGCRTSTTEPITPIVRQRSKKLMVLDSFSIEELSPEKITQKKKKETKSTMETEASPDFRAHLERSQVLKTRQRGAQKRPRQLTKRHEKKMLRKQRRRSKKHNAGKLLMLMLSVRMIVFHHFDVSFVWLHKHHSTLIILVFTF